MPKIKGKILGKAKELILTEAQYAKLQEYTAGQGGLQDLCRKLHDNAKRRNGKLVVTVYTTDMERIERWIERPDTGGWQDLFREIVASNK